MEIKFITLLLYHLLALALCSFISNLDCRNIADSDPLPQTSPGNLSNLGPPQNSADYSGYQPSNPIDDCWRNDSMWEKNRKRLADCGIGFGRDTVGGRDGEIYVVTDEDDDAVNPEPGTLRYGVTQMRPLWIIFNRDMHIELQNELILTSDKTIDARGAEVHIADGPCITIQNVSNVLIHGLNIHDCKPGKAGMVRSSTDHVGHRSGCDGDGITVFGSHTIWIDHNTLSNCHDGLIDVVHESTDVTISNNVFTNHDKVMLLGHSDSNEADKDMRVTVAYNRFGPGCVQRMPRCRFGYFHVVNNDYVGWDMYAIGGSSAPTIVSEGNHFNASKAKQVTKKDCSGECSDWNWRSVNDIFDNGAYFEESGASVPLFDKKMVATERFEKAMTDGAGRLSCVAGVHC